MPQFRKKPVVIEAVQWNFGDNPLECMKPYSASLIDEFPRYKGFYFIETLEGVRHVSDGDFVIKGVAGEFYPCKPDIFQRTYDPVTCCSRFNLTK
jgi:hypothetical protein